MASYKLLIGEEEPTIESKIENMKSFAPGGLRRCLNDDRKKKKKKDSGENEEEIEVQNFGEEGKDKNKTTNEEKDCSMACKFANKEESCTAEEMEEDDKENDEPSNQKKSRLVWDTELHNKFLASINQLEIDKAFPKKILDLMNIDGLSRENLASHLQKFRLGLKKPNPYHLFPFFTKQTFCLRAYVACGINLRGSLNCKTPFSESLLRARNFLELKHILEVPTSFLTPTSLSRPFTDIVYGNRNWFLTILTEPLSFAEESFIVKQLTGLEGCGHDFIWVVRKIDEDESKKGLSIRFMTTWFASALEVKILRI
ncbi:hypothetical protein V8G54_030645 [Vigna mungo]|uniref:Uncharacterized protein n=1 Tax=Vigna mungo TaxID=3915 RepID=A0AAQ3MX43_VIGMU